jgi:coenzyme F420-0:L-glutamate ligase/coenzyme F420-1:gamma-L-glutamate ligase
VPPGIEPRRVSVDAIEHWMFYQAHPDVGVIVSDSFGRAWRQGTTDVALGTAGIAPLRDLRGTVDAAGHELRTTQIAVADEIAGAAELVLGKASAIPAAIVRGVDVRGDGSARELVMPRERDLFR